MHNLLLIYKAGASGSLLLIYQLFWRPALEFLVAEYCSSECHQNGKLNPFVVGDKLFVCLADQICSSQVMGDRRVGRCGMGSPSQQNPRLQTLKEIISITHWQWHSRDREARPDEAIVTGCDCRHPSAMWQYYRTVVCLKSCFCYTAWSFPPSAVALEVSISLFPEPETGTWLENACCVSDWKNKRQVLSSVSCKLFVRRSQASNVKASWTEWCAHAQPPVELCASLGASRDVDT